MLKKVSIKSLDGSKLKIAIVRAKFNEEITSNLLDGCLKALKKLKVKKNKINFFEVPGAYELPFIAKKLAPKVDVVICLGAVIRGETPHFDYVAGQSARGIMDASLQTGKPIIYGVITCDNLKQAVARSSDDKKNKGWQAGIVGVEMGVLNKNLK
jgi:6,7-dimethyl-8-ribityllumazine synthase